MTNDSIEAKALALVNEVRIERDYSPFGESSFCRDFSEHEALCRAIEQHEAFKQEVSDAMLFIATTYPMPAVDFSRFVIPKPKPDPLREIAEAWGLHNTVAKSWVEDLRATLEARGFEIREKNDD